MKLTTNLSLKKPDYIDPVDIQDINSNMDIIDSAIQNKVDNTRVLTDVPLNAKFTDTVYTHPSSHPASMIEESVTKRFVTDEEKQEWNSKVKITIGKTQPNSGWWFEEID